MKVTFSIFKLLEEIHCFVPWAVQKDVRS